MGMWFFPPLRQDEVTVASGSKPQAPRPESDAAAPRTLPLPMTAALQSRKVPTARLQGAFGNVHDFGDAGDEAGIPLLSARLCSTSSLWRHTDAMRADQYRDLG